MIEHALHHFVVGMSHALTPSASRSLTQEALSEFVCFLTSEVNDICREQQRRTMVGEDFLTALRSLDFEEWVEPLSIMLPHMASDVKGSAKVEQAKRQALHNVATASVAGPSSVSASPDTEDVEAIIGSSLQNAHQLEVPRGKRKRAADFQD